MFETTKGILSVGCQVVFGTVFMGIVVCLAVAVCLAMKVGMETFMNFIGF